MKVGIPKELKNHEYRVAMTPAGVHELARSGHEVLVERDAGAGSLIPDDDFVTAGMIPASLLKETGVEGLITDKGVRPISPGKSWRTVAMPAIEMGGLDPRRGPMAGPRTTLPCSDIRF